MSLPGCAAIPAPYRERGQIAYETGVRAVEIVHEDLKPSDILTRKAFENTIVANSAIGGSTNAPIHINAIARHVGVKLDDRGLGESRLRRAAAGQHAAGRKISRRGVFPRRRPAGGDERIAARRSASTPTRSPSTARRWARMSSARASQDADVIKPYDKPMKKQAGFLVLQGQPVRLRDHEDQRDLGGVPQALSVQSEGPERVRGPRRGVRRAGGLSPPHRRSLAQDRRAHACCSCAASGRSAIRARPRW